MNEDAILKSSEILNISMNGKDVGRMVLSPNGLCVFEYAPDYIASGFSISPFYLPLRSGIFTAHRDPFNGLFGVFNDSLPDGWGNMLIDRYLVSRDIAPGKLSVIDRLSIVGTSGMGALEYSPDNSIRASQHMDDINILAAEIKSILNEEEFTGSLKNLVEKGGSSGGARPKVLIVVDGKPWIVKFRSSYDPPDIGLLEYEYSLVAKKCGIRMPETRLFEDKYFGVLRFDRVGNKHIHMHSASGLLYASHRYPSIDYIDLIKATLAITKNMQQANEMFRQMVFNILAGNKDDHAKNFAFLYDQNSWRVSPAYDLVPSEGFNGNHSTTIAGKGNPVMDDILKVIQQCGLVKKTALSIFDEVYSNCREIRLKSW